MSSTAFIRLAGEPARFRPAITDGLRTRARKVAEAAVTPLLPGDVLDLFHPLRAGADLRGRIVSIRPETEDSATIVIRPGRDWAGHEPGQYVRIGVDVDGVRCWRAYSLTHRLGVSDREIAITVKAIPDGVVSNFLVRRARPGLLIHLDQAAGEFGIPIDDAGAIPEKLLLVTAGSGITPVMGVLRNLHTYPNRPDLVLLHINPKPSDSIFRSELREFSSDGRLRLVEHFDSESGLLDLAELERLVPDLAERHTLACGPTGLLDAIEAHHGERNLDLTTERFRPTIIATGEGGTVRFARTETELELDGSTTILDAAEDAGVLMPSGCRMGICFGCVLPLREGAVRDLRNGELTTADPMTTGPVKIQTCVSAAAGACDIDH